MAIEFKKQAFSGKTPVIWRGECKILPGGFKPKQTFPVGTVLRRGLPIQVDFDDMSAGVVKIAKVLDGGTTSAARIGKGHLFVVGDKVQKLGTTTSTTVNKIDIMMWSLSLLKSQGLPLATTFRKVTDKAAQSRFTHRTWLSVLTLSSRVLASRPLTQRMRLSFSTTMRITLSRPIGFRG